jgi:hypothetical protein
MSVVGGLVFCLRESELVAERLVNPLKALEKFLCQGVDGFGPRIGDLDGAAGVSAIVSIEGGDLRRGVFRVIVGELCKGEQIIPIVLLVITEDAEILLQDLVYSLCLSIRLRMIGCQESMEIKARMES